MSKNNKDSENIQEFFEEVKEGLNNKEKKKEKNTKSIILISASIFSIIYFIIFIISAFNHVNYVLEIIDATFALIILFTVTISILGNKKIKNIFASTSGILIILLLTFNILVNKDIFKLPTLEVLKDYTNNSIIDVMSLFKDIKINTNYEYSDNVEEGYIITQDVNPGSPLKEITELTFLVSEGPNYDKEIVLTSLEGSTLEDLLNTIKEKHLNNVTINYKEDNNIEKDIIISQDLKGEIKRNDHITFIISLGKKDNLPNITLEDLTDKSEFDATLYLKRNGISYKTNYEYSENIKRGNVLSQDKEKGITISTKDTITLTISKGKKIIVPDFKDSTVNDVINWASNNRLKLAFKESYDNNIAKGNLIGINYTFGTTIEEETKIIVNSSKGALTFPKFNNLNEFINWCNTYNVKYQQEYQFNDSVKKGNIIKFSKNENDKVDPNTDSIKAYISYGSPVIVPNFNGQSKSNIQSTCNSKGLNCTFYYTNYSNVAKDVATKQSVGAGNTVVSGSYVSIGLSKGPAKKCHIYIQDGWLGGSYDEAVKAINSGLQAELKDAGNQGHICNDITFKFVSIADNTVPAGMVHSSSPIRSTYEVTEGETYTIVVTK